MSSTIPALLRFPGAITSGDTCGGRRRRLEEWSGLPVPPVKGIPWDNLSLTSAQHTERNCVHTHKRGCYCSCTQTRELGNCERLHLSKCTVLSEACYLSSVTQLISALQVALRAGLILSKLETNSCRSDWSTANTGHSCPHVSLGLSEHGKRQGGGWRDRGVCRRQGGGCRDRGVGWGVEHFFFNGMCLNVGGIHTVWVL